MRKLACGRDPQSMGRLCNELVFRTPLTVTVISIMAGNWISLYCSPSYALEKFHQVSIVTAQTRDLAHS